MKYFFIVPFLLLNYESYGNQILGTFDIDTPKQWVFFTDRVMGGRSNGKVEFIQLKKINFARMTGTVSTENNGGFIQFRSRLKTKLKQDIKSVKLNVRGNNEKYFIHLRTNGTVVPWQYYSVSFMARQEWSEINIPLENFKRSGIFLKKKLKPQNIRSLAIVAYGREYKALIDVSHIEFY